MESDIRHLLFKLTMAKPANNADVREEALSCALLRSYLNLNLICKEYRRPTCISRGVQALLDACNQKSD